MRKAIVWLLLLATLMACERHADPEQVRQEKQEVPRLAAEPMTVNEAVIVAMECAEGLLGRGTSPVGVTPFLSSRTRGDNGSHDTLLLAVHMAGGGLVFVDKRLEASGAVLCVLPSTNRLDSVPPPAQFLIEAISELSLSQESTMDSLAPIGDSLSTEKGTRGGKRPPESAHFPPRGDFMPIEEYSQPENDYIDYTHEESTAGPWLKTSWKQDGGFNKHCIVNGKQCKARCVPVAIGQILAYYQLPSEIPWSSVLRDTVPTSEEDMDHVSRLLFRIGQVASASFGEQGTGVKDQKIVPALWELGLSCTGREKYNDNAMEDLKKGFPVIMVGSKEDRGFLGYSSGGHSWVIDGLHTIEKCQNRHNGNGYLLDTECRLTLYAHANMGWGGPGNGWYSFSCFDTPAGAYKYYLRFYPGIRPK